MKTKEAILKKRILGSSILFHAAIIVFAMSTYFTVKSVKESEIIEPTNFIEIQFTNSSKSSGMASTKKNTVETPTKKATPRAIEKKVIKVEPLEEIGDIPPVNETKNSKNVSEVENIEVSKTEGDGEEGKMITGIALGSLEFDGEGVFGRKVIYHAPIKKIAEIDGRVAINLGINRAGKVIGVAINKESTTIEDSDLLRKALKMAILYRFESDYTAPKIQYGKFTFIFNLNQ